MTFDVQDAPTIRVSAIIIREHSHILLVKHRKSEKEYWVLPGGHLEYGETFAECALRELKEETGLEGDFIRIVFLSQSIAPNQSRHIINIFCLVEVGPSSAPKLMPDPIVCEVGFVPLSQLEYLTVYPSIADDILLAENQGWPETSIRELQTPWT